MEEKKENGRMLAVKYLPKYTYKDLELWEGNWELIDGIPFAMSPAPGFKHQYLNSKLVALFLQAIEESGCKHCTAVIPINFKISDNTVVQPDLSLFCGKVDGVYITDVPKLVVEILSPSTGAKDKELKFHLYENQKVRYYLVIDPVKETIEVFQIKENKYILISQIQSNSDSLKINKFNIDLNCELSLDFSGLFQS